MGLPQPNPERKIDHRTISDMIYLQFYDRKLNVAIAISLSLLCHLNIPL